MTGVVPFWRRRRRRLTNNKIASARRTETAPSAVPIAVPVLKNELVLLGLGQVSMI